MRIRPNDLCMSEAMPFQQHHEARTMHPVREVFEDELAFMDVRGNLRVGDLVTLCSYENISKTGDSMSGLKEFGSGRVVAIGQNGVRLQPTGPVISVNADPAVLMEEAPEDKLVVKRAFAGMFDVRDAESGAVLDTFKSKAAAVEFKQAYSDG